MKYKFTYLLFGKLSHQDAALANCTQLHIMGNKLNVGLVIEVGSFFLTCDRKTLENCKHLICGHLKRCLETPAQVQELYKPVNSHFDI